MEAAALAHQRSVVSGSRWSPAMMSSTLISGPPLELLKGQWTSD
jgi:hypothetical protein